MSGNPLDFSFLKLQSVEGISFLFTCMLALRKEEPRAGKRRPIEESDDEEEAKKVGIFKLKIAINYHIE